MSAIFILFLVVTLGIVFVVAWKDITGRLRKTQSALDEVQIEVAALRGSVLRGSGQTRIRAPQPRPEPLAAEPRSPTPTPADSSKPSQPAKTTEPEMDARPLGTSSVVPTTTPPRLSPIGISWEHWVGVRGAALLGGIVLALAGLLFLKFAIDHGLIPPSVRVIASILVGLASIWSSEILRKRDYSITASSLAGAGVVILYGAFWAADQLYGLIPTGPAFGLMILTTVACGMLAWHHRAQVIAILGLAGGFATPLVLQSGIDNPLGLFGYILVLDTGLLVLARHLRWPALGGSRGV